MQNIDERETLDFILCKANLFLLEKKYKILYSLQGILRSSILNSCNFFRNPNLIGKTMKILSSDTLNQCFCISLIPSKIPVF